MEARFSNTKTLSKELAAGRREAFAELYDALADRVYRFLVVRLGSPTDADDVLQEIFVRLARRRGSFEEVKDLVAYVFTVARNEAARFARRRSRRRAVETSLETSLEAGPIFLGLAGQRQGEGVEQHELTEMIAVGLSRLKEKHREVIELKSFAGLTFAEIATVTGTPQGTVATRYRKAIGQLRTFFERQGS